MKYQRLLNTIIRNLWLIILCTVIATSLYILYSSYFVLPQYEATSTLYVTSIKPELQSSIISKDLVRDYCELILDSKVLNEVIKNLKYKTTFDDISKKISVKQKNSTNVILIKVRDEKAKVALKIADKISEIAIMVINKLAGNENINEVGNSQISPGSISPISTKNIIMTVFATIIGVILILYVYNLFDNLIRSEDDIENIVGLEVIGKVPKHKLNIKKISKRN